jgi:chemotaxis protein MotB
MPTPPIIIRKKVVHGGHHGGAWKVAYADFVTAMMALFIVLWLMNTSKPIAEAVGGYFRDPAGTGKKIGTNQVGSGENFRVTKENMAELKEQLQKRIQNMIDLEKLHKNIEMTITAEGLRIELLESDKGTFFDSGSPNLKSSGQEMLALLAAQLGQVPNHLSIEGHTDAKPYSGKSNYSNWELSADRANAARRLMQQSGLRADQVAQVRGFADQRLRSPKEPLEASNRRVSIIVQYLPSDNPDAPEAKGLEPSPKDNGEHGPPAQPASSEVPATRN